MVCTTLSASGPSCVVRENGWRSCRSPEARRALLVRISFPRHFVLLACVAILQVTVIAPREWTLAGLPLALQGALHALALAGAALGARALARRALFVVCAALLASAAFYGGAWLNFTVDHVWHL